ncbi:uncharacterized protein V6R79_025287 [Siganus canaliculatus]
MNETTIQLPEMNAATITQWYSRRCRSQEQAILKQGVQAPDAPLAGPERLPAAMQKSPDLYSENSAEAHIFILPPNTAGKAKLKGRLQPRPSSQAPPFHPALPAQTAPAPVITLPFILTSGQLPAVAGPSQVMAAPGSSQVMALNMPLPPPLPQSTQLHTSSVPYTTQQYRKRKQERERSGTFTRKYVKKTDVILCKKCNKERRHPSHQQYFGNWYCEESETQSYSEWRAVLEKRGYGRKKTGSDNPPAP